jgi:Rrf2 family protein
VSSMLRISEAASLAMHTAALLAVEPKRRLSTAQVASTLGVSEAHLAKVLQRLARAGLVRSERGPHGGFQLAGDPAQVTLIEIYEAIEGPLRPVECLLGKRVCRGEHCILGKLASSIDQQVREYLGGTHLAELVDVYAGVSL